MDRTTFEVECYGIDRSIAEAYAESLREHIAYVYEAGLKIGVPKAQLSIHDDSKWTEFEFPGYARHFKGGGAPDEFAVAWLHHIHFNPHHWQHWIFSDGYTPKNSGVENGLVEMPFHFILEMIADWMGASRAYTGSWDMKDWLWNHIPKIRIHSKTATVLRNLLDGYGYADIVYIKKFASEGESDG